MLACLSCRPTSPLHRLFLPPLYSSAPRPLPAALLTPLLLLLCPPCNPPGIPRAQPARTSPSLCKRCMPMPPTLHSWLLTRSGLPCGCLRFLFSALPAHLGCRGGTHGVLHGAAGQAGRVGPPGLPIRSINMGHSNLHRPQEREWVRQAGRGGCRHPGCCRRIPGQGGECAQPGGRAVNASCGAEAYQTKSMDN